MQPLELTTEWFVTLGKHLSVNFHKPLSGGLYLKEPP